MVSKVVFALVVFFLFSFYGVFCSARLMFDSSDKVISAERYELEVEPQQLRNFLHTHDYWIEKYAIISKDPDDTPQSKWISMELPRPGGRKLRKSEPGPNPVPSGESDDPQVVDPRLQTDTKLPTKLCSEAQSYI